METDVTIRQCDECGNRIWSDKDANYAKIPTRSVPRRVRKGRNATYRRHVGIVCGMCALSEDLQNARPDKQIAQARAG